jgi:guanine deaminase
VLDPGHAAARAPHARSLEELLFAFALLGDDRAVYRTYAAGRRARARRRRAGRRLT